MARILPWRLFGMGRILGVAASTYVGAARLQSEEIICEARIFA
jgi:hypothetical protein